jgi:large subunit ribosomal protein L21
MFAVIKTGGKQYKVAANDLVRIEKIAGDAGDAVTFENVLMVGADADVTLGAPLVDGALVAGEVVEQFRDKKVIIFKKKRRQGYRRKNGHRQELTLVRITEILTGGAKPSGKKSAPKKAAAKAEDAKADTTTDAKADDANAPAKQAPAKKDDTEAKAKPAAKKAAAKADDSKTEAKKAPAKKAPAKKADADKADKE